MISPGEKAELKSRKDKPSNEPACQKKTANYMQHQKNISSTKALSEAKLNIR